MNLRVAMWSGPRNISTAMMRAWENRGDTYVCDEPFYAHYLQVTGRDHPGAEQVIAHHETDWRRVVAWLTGEIPEGKPIFFQKQMAHHLLPEIEQDWLEQMTNCFLIREPREMITSLIQKTPDPNVMDTALPQQVELFRRVRERTGTTPTVLDARDVLEDPRGQLGLLCERLGVPFTEHMLSWPPGRRRTDGVWAKYWYEALESSTSFRPYRPKPDEVPDRFQSLQRECDEFYEELHAHRLGA